MNRGRGLLKQKCLGAMKCIIQPWPLWPFPSNRFLKYLVISAFLIWHWQGQCPKQNPRFLPLKPPFFSSLLYLREWCHHLPLSPVRESGTPLLSLSPAFPLALSSKMSPNSIRWTNTIYLNFVQWCLLSLVIASLSHYQGFLLGLKMKTNPISTPHKVLYCLDHAPFPGFFWVIPPLAYYVQCGRWIILMVSLFHASLCPYLLVIASHTDSELMFFTSLGR